MEKTHTYEGRVNRSMYIKVRTRLQRILNLVPVLDFLTLTDLASFL